MGWLGTGSFQPIGGVIFAMGDIRDEEQGR